MSVRQHPPADEPMSARVLEISDLPVSRIPSFAADAGDVHFERRGGRTFLVTGK